MSFIKRRDFLWSSGAALLVAGAGSYWALRPARHSYPPKGFLFGEGEREPPLDKKKEKNSRRHSRPGAMTIVDQQGHIFRRWQTPFSPHTVKQNPQHPFLLVGVQKWGPHIAIARVDVPHSVDLILAEEHYDFFGHAEFLDQGRLMAVSAHNWAQNKGEIHLFETKNFHKVAVIPSFGSSPHDIQADRNNPDILVIANSGTYLSRPLSTEPQHQPKMTWVQWRSQTLVKSIDTPDKQLLIPGHFQQTDDQRLFIYGPRLRAGEGPSFAAFEYASEKLQVLNHPFNPQDRGECLNSYYDKPRNRLWLIAPEAGKVVILDGTSYEKIRELPLKSPRSITPFFSDILYISYEGEFSNQQAAFDIPTMQQISVDQLRMLHGPRTQLPNVYAVHTSSFKSPLL